MNSIVNDGIGLLVGDMRFFSLAIRFRKDALQPCASACLRFGRRLSIGVQDREKEPIVRLKCPAND